MTSRYIVAFFQTKDNHPVVLTDKQMLYLKKLGIYPISLGVITE